jgi:hypothetical protein
MWTTVKVQKQLSSQNAKVSRPRPSLDNFSLFEDLMFKTTDLPHVLIKKRKKHLIKTTFHLIPLEVLFGYIDHALAMTHLSFFLCGPDPPFHLRPIKPHLPNPNKLISRVQTLSTKIYASLRFRLHFYPRVRIPSPSLFFPSSSCVPSPCSANMLMTGKLRGDCW